MKLIDTMTGKEVHVGDVVKESRWEYVLAEDGSRLPRWQTVAWKIIGFDTAASNVCVHLHSVEDSRTRYLMLPVEGFWFWKKAYITL